MFDRVSLTQTLPVVLREYGKTVEAFIKQENIQVPQDGNRCTKKCPKLNIRCMREKDHDKGESKCRCQFTPRDLLSASSVEKFADSITSGSLKTLAGLDDEDVIKGHDNFKRLNAIANLLCDRTSKSKAERDKLIDEIKECEVFHDTTFVGHVHDTAEKICMCRACGFTSQQEAATKGKKHHGDHVDCPYRENSSHTGPCNDCEKSFELFSTLLRLAKEAENLPNATASDKDDFFEIGVELETRRQNLIGLRSHKVRKKAESDYDRRQVQNLGPDECIIISDFKMKILAMYFRENMRLFYGKRGISCLGFMVIKACEEDDKVDAHFYLFFSNDTTQDSQFVLSSKAAMYTEVLPELFPDGIDKINVHFRADGAGCFNSNPAKSVMHMWERWTSKNEVVVDEISIRISVNGGGKSELDCKFGQVALYQRAAVNNGADITDAESCMDVWQDGPGISGTTAALITPVRDNIIQTGDGLGLTKYYHLKRNDGSDSIQGFSVSGYGKGVEISIKSIEGSWPTPPTMPQYVVQWQVGTEKSKETAHHSKEGSITRRKRRLDEKVASRKKKKEEDRLKEYENNVAKGIFNCTHMATSGKMVCTASFLSEKCLRKHMSAGKHNYPSLNLVDMAVAKVSAPGGLMATGTRRNRYEEYDQSVVQEGTGAGKSEGDDWHALGCYLKEPAKKRTRFTPHVKADLLAMFIDGEEAEGGTKKGKAKFTKVDAQNTLKDMRILDPKTNENMRKYTSRSKFGPLLNQDQIGNIFAAFKRELVVVGLDGLKKTLEQLRAAPTQKNASKKKATTKAKNTTTKKKSAAKKDPNAPKRPANAYLLFCASHRELVKQQRPDLCPRDITKELALRWKKIEKDERKKYDNEAKEAMDKWKVDMEEYEKTRSSNETKSTDESVGATPDLSAKTNHPTKGRRKSVQWSEVIEREDQCESSASDSDDIGIAVRARTQKKDSKLSETFSDSDCSSDWEDGLPLKANACKVFREDSESDSSSCSSDSEGGYDTDSTFA